MRSEPGQARRKRVNKAVRSLYPGGIKVETEESRDMHPLRNPLLAEYRTFEKRSRVSGFVLVAFDERGGPVGVKGPRTP